MQVQPQQRDYAKQLAYGLLYGKGAHALAVDLSCDVKRAAAHHDSFLKSIPDVVSQMADGSLKLRVLSDHAETNACSVCCRMPPLLHTTLCNSSSQCPTGLLHECSLHNSPLPACMCDADIAGPKGHCQTGLPAQCLCKGPISINKGS